MPTPSAPIPSIPTPVYGNCCFYYGWSEPLENGGSPVTTYKLVVTPNGSSSSEYTINAPFLCRLVEGLTPNVSCEATVCASNDNGATWGPTASFDMVTPIAAPQEGPATVSATRLTDTTASITWTAPSIPPITTYSYYILSQSSDSNDPIVGSTLIPSNTFEYQMEGLTPASTYTFQVYVQTEGGQSPPMTTNSVSPL